MVLDQRSSSGTNDRWTSMTEPSGPKWISRISGPRIEHGRSIEEAAVLCRADSVDDVARKCEELGLKPKPTIAGA